MPAKAPSTATAKSDFFILNFPIIKPKGCTYRCDNVFVPVRQVQPRLTLAFDTEREH
jgi:hypothetical protein